MNFNDSIEKNYFHTLNEAKTFRPQVWKKSSVIIEKLINELYDNFDIEESVFVINDFFDKNIYSLNKIDVLVKLDKNKFEELVESKIIEKYQADDINFHFMVEDVFYVFNVSFFKKESLNLDMVKSYNGK